MMTLACLAAAGLIMGMFLNSYALAAASFGVALASGVMAANVGFGHASILMIVGLILLQVGYFVGLFASTFLYPSRAATVPTSRV
jgi:hypothetical protein